MRLVGTTTILGLVAAVSALLACESSSDESDSATSTTATGGGTGATTGSGSGIGIGGTGVGGSSTGGAGGTTGTGTGGSGGQPSCNYGKVYEQSGVVLNVVSLILVMVVDMVLCRVVFDAEPGVLPGWAK